MEKREIEAPPKRIWARIEGVTPQRDGQLLHIETEEGRLSLIINDERARWLGAVLSEHYRLFQSERRAGGPAVLPEIPNS